MPHRLHVVVIVLLVGCGTVKKDPPATDDARPGEAGTCADPNSVESCGAACTACEAPDRATPTCDGVACDFACNDLAPQCTDASCSRVSWKFDSGMVDGITARTPPSLPLAVRNHAGNQALAIDVTSLTSEISFRIPICIAGTVDMSQKAFKATVFFEGGDPSMEQYYIQFATPQPGTRQYLGSRGVQAGQYVTLSGPFSMSSAGGAVTDVTIQAGSYGAAFAGTIWFDDIVIE